MHKHIIAHRQRIDDLFEKVEKVEDMELQSEWAKYLCVLVSGYLERSACTILEDFAEDKSHPFVQNYVGDQLEYLNSPKAGNISSIVRSFSPTWADQLEDAWEGELKTSVNSVVSTRHRIAHGENVDITFTRILSHYEKAVLAIEKMDDICGGG